MPLWTPNLHQRYPLNPNLSLGLLNNEFKGTLVSKVSSPVSQGESNIAVQDLALFFNIPRLQQKLIEYGFDLNTVVYYLLKGSQAEKLEIYYLLQLIYYNSKRAGNLLTTNPGVADDGFDLNQKLKNKPNNGTLYVFAAVFALVLLGFAIYFIKE